MDRKMSKQVEESAKVLLYKPSEEIDLKTMPLKEKMTYLKSNITVEPIVFLFIVASTLSSFAVQNLYIDKACRVNLQFSEKLCMDLQLRKNDNHTLEEIEVQKLKKRTGFIGFFMEFFDFNSFKETVGILCKKGRSNRRLKLFLLLLCVCLYCGPLMGTIFAICIFSKKLKSHDSILGMTSMASKILGTLVIMFAKQDYQVYLCTYYDSLTGR
ncbi:unnamed protein product [Parnassius apollo]|uniref:(apollo) hypothetical protein n=1 Tax=Parnassius apollo TaxID=110799 RepID=A0A8S3Y8N3_PARAO|nr:unnamed protein product [Parnassius apollo]